MTKQRWNTSFCIIWKTSTLHGVLTINKQFVIAKLWFVCHLWKTHFNSLMMVEKGLCCHSRRLSIHTQPIILLENTACVIQYYEIGCWFTIWYNKSNYHWRRGVNNCYSCSISLIHKDYKLVQWQVGLKQKQQQPS